MNDQEKLHPTLEESRAFQEESEQFMEKIKPIFHEKLKKMLSDIFDEIYNDKFEDIVLNLEYNAFSVIRDKIIEGLRGYTTAKNYRHFYFADVRKKMVEENREEIINDYINDLEKKIKDQEELISFLQRSRY